MLFVYKKIILGSPHFILSDDYFVYADSGRLQLFLGFNGSIELRASICDRNIEEKYCLKNSEDLVDIYLKSSDFQFIVFSEFSMRNIRFFGNDVILSGLKNNSCLHQRNVCCSSLTNDCSIENKLLIYSENYFENNSFILIKSDGNNEVPRLFLTNIVFFNFYSLEKGLGWKALLISKAKTKSILLNNMKIVNFHFSHGIWLDFDFFPPEFLSSNNISLTNVFFENQSFAFSQDRNYTENKIGLLNFMNSSNYSINITNITIQSINNYYHLQNYFFYFESNTKYHQNNLYINNLIFENSTNIGLLYIEGCFQIFLNDFAIRNITYSQETYFFIIFNESKIIMNNGLISMIFGSNLFFFCQKCLQISLNSVSITKFYGRLGFVSDSAISISNSHFENIKSDYLLSISLSDLSIIKSNFSSSIFNQTAFKIFDATNFLYNESWCMNVSTPKFISLQSQSSSNYLVEAKIIVYFRCRI